MTEPPHVPQHPEVEIPTHPSAEAHLPPGVVRGPETERQFKSVLVNTLIANVTSSYLWFALTFWIYLQTKSVLATAIVGGSYMLFLAVLGTFFGTLVDRHKKWSIMLVSSVATLIAYAVAAALYVVFDQQSLIDWNGPVFWVFAGAILAGSVVESLRNIALSTTVTLLVPGERRDKANGMVGAVQGMAFMVTSVFSGLSIGQLGMGWTMVIAVTLTGVSLLHLLIIKIPEAAPDPAERGSAFDFKGALGAIVLVPGLTALIIYSTFNNLVGGVFMALMDPYGLTLFSVEMWGIVLGVTSAGFIVGGLMVAKLGLGASPVRTLLLVNVIVAMVGLLFAIRELWWLYAFGIFVYLCFIPFAEAAEQTIMQRVVPFAKQGRVFGFAQSVEVAASPISAFLIGPIAQYGLIPYMETDAGRDRWGWLVGSGDARGIALVFIGASVIMLITVLLALISPPYRRLKQAYAESPEPISEAAQPAG